MTKIAETLRREALRKSNLDRDKELLGQAADAIERMGRCLGFFASVIKSGEPWTDTCETEYRKAFGIPPPKPKGGPIYGDPQEPPDVP